MNFDDYEKKYFSTYEAFAETVRFILENAFRAAGDLPHPQSVQCRAKGVDSLRRRLAETGELDTQTLELDRRDLAGARVIFYTNNDVDSFKGSSVIRDNFEIEEDSTRIHSPTPENKGTRYRAIHYTIRLRENRICLPEYARFAGLRCEIQIQTILNHAWSETSHDIIYKNTLGDDFGQKAMEGIRRRFKQVMDKYLLPAGYEIQKAQQEYERLLHGKEFFDKDIVNLLDNAQNNNERYEILSEFKDFAIPNYDDLPEAYEELKDHLLRAVKAARGAESVPIETAFGNLDGYDADAVTRLIVEIVENLRYVDVIGTLGLLIDIYRDESNDDIRSQIVNAVRRLSEYNIDAYERVGPMLQMELVNRLADMSDAMRDSIRPIALTVWKESLKSDITGTNCKADSVVFRTGAVPGSDQLREVRDKATQALFTAYDRSTDDAQKREVLSALDAATTTPGPVRCSNELMAITLADAARIVDFVTERAKATSYELLQHLEHRFYNDYFCMERLKEDPENQFDCKDEAAALMAAILKFRDTINVDDRFVRYKVLVGFESVYPDHWTSKEFDYKGADEYRNGEADRYIDEIDAASENEWFDLIARCAQTESNDLATFPVFGRFISRLAERKPEVADKLLASASDDLRNFLPGFLKGLALSGRSDIYERVLKSELECARNLAGLASYLRHSNVSKPEFAARVLERAIEKDDSTAVTVCLLFAVEHYGTEKIANADTFVRDALSFLNDRKDPRWVKQARFLRKATKFSEELTPERMRQILQNLSYLPRVDYEAELVLTRLAEHQPEAVWDYFGARLAREATEGEDDERFEAVPFRLHGLEKELSKDPQLGIRKGLSWFERERERERFEFRGGRLLSNAFPNCTPEFAAALAELVRAGGDTEADFALAILRNYHGKISTHTVLKEIVSRYPDDDSKMSLVCIVIDNTGVVCGEFGIAEAYRTKKEALEKWLTDERPAVKAFAEKHIAELDLMITSAQARVEAAREMRKRDYDEEDGASDPDDGDGDESTG
jgi:ppGpp synthetase/RelA/SpoT-type nucleotidyltranferase